MQPCATPRHFLGLQLISAPPAWKSRRSRAVQADCMTFWSVSRRTRRLCQSSLQQVRPRLVKKGVLSSYSNFAAMAPLHNEMWNACFCGGAGAGAEGLTEAVPGLRQDSSHQMSKSHSLPPKRFETRTLNPRPTKSTQKSFVSGRLGAVRCD